LEKIEMKKTLVAVAAMAVVTGAMANVTIGGLVDQALTSTKATTSGGVTTTTKSIGPTVNGASELFFTGSEDLGDGIKASFRLGLNMTADDNGASTTTNSSANASNRISYVELSGGFGSVQLGQQWKPGFFVILAADPTNLTGSSGIVGPGQMAAYTANSLTYNAPSFVPGLAIQYQMGRGEASASNAGNSSGYSLTYNNGPLSVAYGAGKSTAAATASTTFVTSVAQTNLGSVTINSSVLNSTATNVAYDLGMVKVNAYTATTKLAGTTSQHKGSGFGLSIPVNASTRLAVFSSGATGTNGSGTQEKETGTKYAVFHNLSKRTMAYGFVGKSSTSGALNASGQTAFGLMHSF
jgi:predicted porin